MIFVSSTFSPHTRGCSASPFLPNPVDKVFPAYAGMFRSRVGNPWPRVRFPRIRGDVPVNTVILNHFIRFSPHTRGCSAAASSRALARRVFPAYAGMFLDPSYPISGGSSFPRIRGDVPGFAFCGESISVFSPHTRGCSHPCGNHEKRPSVFPAYAGMFRWGAITS